MTDESGIRVMEGNGFRIAFYEGDEEDAPFQSAAILPPEGNTKSQKFEDSDLRVKHASFETSCDGCGNTIDEGDKIVTGIDSCCGGGCWRRLCMNCVFSVLQELVNVN